MAHRVGVCTHYALIALALRALSSWSAIHRSNKTMYYSSVVERQYQRSKSSAWSLILTVRSNSCRWGFVMMSYVQNFSCSQKHLSTIIAKNESLKEMGVFTIEMGDRYLLGIHFSTITLPFKWVSHLAPRTHDALRLVYDCLRLVSTG